MDITFLRSTPLFSAMSDDELVEIADLLEVREYAPLQPIVFIGDSRADMLIVMAGRVVVSYPEESGQEVSIEKLWPGAFFGEFSLLAGGQLLDDQLDRDPRAVVTGLPIVTFGSETIRDSVTDGLRSLVLSGSKHSQAAAIRRQTSDRRPTRR